VTVRLRTQLALAFLLLAVVPLLGITVWSYLSSERAFRVAVHEEVQEMAEEMGDRTEAVLQELSDRLRRMRERRAETSGGAFEKARQEALLAAEQAEMRQLLLTILSATDRRQGAIPFAFDASKQVYTPDVADVRRLQGFGVVPRPPDVPADPDGANWVVVLKPDPTTGLTVGVARPVGEGLRETRRAAVRNLAGGLGLVGLALLGIIPLSGRMTRHLRSLTEGAERLAAGDLDVRVPVPRGAEFGRLAETFNRMARDLHANQERRIQQERLHKELEISRRIQEELLPRGPVVFPFAEASGVSIPAREVGGDFFNYFSLSTEEAAILVGDVSGKGVPAALLMANLQATLRARLPLEPDLARLVDALDRELERKTPGALYLTLFIAVLEAKGCLRYVNAGHNTQFLLHAEGGLQRLESTGRPVGLLPGGGYSQSCLTVKDGDLLFLFTDGLVEAENEAGDAFGMDRLEALLLDEREGDVSALLARVDQAIREHRGAMDAADDATMLVLRVGHRA
jgi:serine phosphatase RsbU (regulator of sigma subunit)